MIEYVRQIAKADVEHGKGAPDLRNAPSQVREAADAARAAALEQQGKK